MKDLYEIFINSNFQNKRVVLKRNIFYSVKIIPVCKKQVYLLKNWRLGLVGKHLFKNKFVEYNSVLMMVKDYLEEKKYKIIPLHYFPQSDN